MMNAWQAATVGVVVVTCGACLVAVVGMVFGALVKAHPACGPEGGSQGGGKKSDEVGRADVEAARTLARRRQERERNKAADRDRVHGTGWVNGKSRLDLVG